MIKSSKWLKLFVVFFVLSSFVSVACKPKPTPTAPQDAQAWTEKMFTKSSQYVPFWFNYKETPASINIKFTTWNQTSTSQQLDENRVKWVRTFTDPNTGLQVRCEATQYLDYPAVEWVTYLTNTGSSVSWHISNVLPANFVFESNDATECNIYYSYGIMDIVAPWEQHKSPAKTAAEEFMLVKDHVGETGKSVTLSSINGRSSCGHLPFFNIENIDSKGSIMAIGWSGDWTTNLSYLSSGVLVKSAIPDADFQLLPGETVRTPSFLRMFYDDTDGMRGHNKFRKLMLKHFTPQVNGHLPEPVVAASAHGKYGFADTTEGNLVGMINSISSANVPINTFWVDAGWYEMQRDFGTNDDFICLKGDWAADASRFPNGLKPVSDAAHAKGYKFLLWFEPERVSKYANVLTEHPEWIMPAVGVDDYVNKVLNLGNPLALDWVISTFAGLIDGYGVDIYRQDMNAYAIAMSWDQEDTASSTPKDFYNFMEDTTFGSQDMGAWTTESADVINLAMDFNGDGKDELTRISKESGKAVARVYRATSTGFETTAYTTVEVGDWAPNGVDAVFTPMDINGDSKADLFYKYMDGSGQTQAQVLISNGTSFAARNTRIDIGGWAIEGSMVKDFPCDINGDGKDDLVRVFSYDGGKMGIDTLFVNTSSNFTRDGAPAMYSVGNYSENGAYVTVMVMDVGTYGNSPNGSPDNRDDLVRIYKNASGKAISDILFSNGSVFNRYSGRGVQDLGDWAVAGVETKSLGMKVNTGGSYDLVRLWKDPKGLAESDILYADGYAFGRISQNQMTDIGSWNSEYVPFDINGDGMDEILTLTQSPSDRAVAGILSYGHILVPAYSRYGIAELKHIAGLYGYWDNLRATRPGLLIDNCASGGGRLDYEALRRSVALWRSDQGEWNAEANQNETLGLSYWLPLTGRGAVSIDPYSMRSGFGWCTAYAVDWENGSVASAAATAISSLKDLQILASGDFYPLAVPDDVTAINTILAWQYDMPELKKGMVQVFRRAGSSQTSLKLKLSGIDSNFWSFAKYKLSIYSDSNPAIVKTYSGYNLANTGFTVNIASAPGSAIVVYEKL